MRQIQLLAVELENFRSFRQATMIELSSGAGLKFLSGANKVEPKLGANGAGKSTIWDAVAYCVTGASVRGVRASDLASWGGGKPRVMTAWEINGEIITIERHGSPERILLEDQPVDQATIDRTLGLSRGRFLQSVIFGQSVPLFIDLSGPERGALLDEVLDLGIWLKAAELASKRHGEQEKAIVAIDTELAFLKGKQAGFEDTDALEVLIVQWEDQQTRRVEDALAEVEKAEAVLAAATNEHGKATRALGKTVDTSALDAQMTAQRNSKTEREIARAQILLRQKQLAERITFYTLTKDCPECEQPITPAHTKRHTVAIVAEQADLDKKLTGLDAQIKSNDAEMAKLETQLAEQRRGRDVKIAAAATAQAGVEHAQRALDRAAKVAEQISNADNPHQARYEALLEEMIAVEDKIKETNTTRRQTQGLMLRTDFWKAAFKRVRLFMVKRVLAQLEVETASAAVALGLIDWKISFSTELETKSGSVRPGIHIVVKSPIASAPWEVWSGGEGQRIRLAVALGLSSLIQRLGGVSIGFEVHDEPSAWLSQEGIDDLITHLQHRVQVTGKSIWLCDHRSLSQAAFDEIWEVSKTRDGSQVKMIGNHD